MLDFLTGFASFFQGMWVTAVNLVGRRKITLLYPYERRDTGARYRGLFFLTFDAEGRRLKCTGCTLCAQACPTDVISMTKMGAGKHGTVSEFTMDLGRCMFCNLCVEACPFDAIHMGPVYELSSLRRDASVFRITDLAQGGAAAVEETRTTISEALADEEAAKAAKARASEERPVPPAREAVAAGATSKETPA